MEVELDRIRLLLDIVGLRFLLNHLLKILGLFVEPYLADQGRDADQGFIGAGDVFRRVLKFERDENRHARFGAVQNATLQCGQDFRQRHGRGSRPQALHGFPLHAAGEHADFLAVKIRQGADRRAARIGGVGGAKHADHLDALGFADMPERFFELGVLNGPETVGLILEDARRGENLKALINPDQECRRHHGDFDRAELHALDHARDRAKLAQRKHLDVDGALGPFLHPFLKCLHPEMDTFLDGRRPDLDNGFGVGGQRRSGDGKGNTARNGREWPG